MCIFTFLCLSPVWLLHVKVSLALIYDGNTCDKTVLLRDHKRCTDHPPNHCTQPHLGHDVNRPTDGCKNITFRILWNAVGNNLHRRFVTSDRLSRKSSNIILATGIYRKDARFAHAVACTRRTTFEIESLRVCVHAH